MAIRITRKVSNFTVACCVWWNIPLCGCVSFRYGSAVWAIRSGGKSKKRWFDRVPPEREHYLPPNHTYFRRECSTYHVLITELVCVSTLCIFQIFKDPQKTSLKQYSVPFVKFWDFTALLSQESRSPEADGPGGRVACDCWRLSHLSAIKANPVIHHLISTRLFSISGPRKLQLFVQAAGVIEFAAKMAG